MLQAPRPGTTPELRLSRLQHFLLLAMPVVLTGGGGVSDKGMMDSVIRDCGGGQGGRGGAERRSTDLGSEVNIGSWVDWSGKCCRKECGRLLQNGVGLFCANFCHEREPFRACRSAWCDGCYRKHPDDNFRVTIPLDEDGEPMKKGDDEFRFQYGRCGDHLITAFQCDRCHVRNMLWREPRETDRFLMVCLRRAILDSLWSREPGTVSSTYSRARALENYGVDLGIGQVGPHLTPYALADDFGMKVALTMVLKSLEAGRNAETVQYDTIRQLRTAYSNMYRASTYQLGTTIYAKERKKLHATNCQTDGIWFGKFALGMEKRMGRQVVQDLGISIEVMHELQDLLEADWRVSNTTEERRKVCEAAFIFIGVFCWGLRGEEIFLVTLGATRQVWKYCRHHPTDHIMLALVGRRKKFVGERAFLLPCVYTTKSGLQPGRWMERIMGTFEIMGVITGYLFFQGNGRKPQLRHYDEVFVKYLTRVQDSHPGLIPGELEVGCEYGLGRSGRRGLATHLRNMGVKPVDIEAHQMWRKTELNVGRNFKVNGMLQYYTELSQSLPTLLRCSSQI